MKTTKTILATLALLLTISVMSAQSLIVIKKGNLITVTDKATKALLCNQPTTATSTIPAINFVGFYVVVDGVSINAYNATCASVGRMNMIVGSTVGAPTLPTALFSVTNNGEVQNYNSSCRPVN